MMAMVITLVSILVIVVALLVVSNINFKKTIKDPKKWNEMIRKQNVSYERQEKIIKNNNLPYEPIDLSEPSNKHSQTKHSTLDEFQDDLTIVWEGETKPIEFTYEGFNGNKKRRTVRPSEIYFNGEGVFYIKGFCELRNESRSFKQHNFTTKIKVGNNRYDFEEWCDEILGIDVFSVCPNSDIAFT